VIIKTFTRGSNVNISVTFHDSAGGVIAPTGAQVTLSYVAHGSNPPCPIFITYPLTQSGTSWVYDWDSSAAAAGVVSGHADTADLPDAAVDFEFRVTAGRANKELAGDVGTGTGY
jgi:hypothetical protein